MLYKILILMVISLFSTFSLSKELIINGQIINIGPIVANGSGCPRGTVTAVASGDNKAVAVLFSNYNAFTNEDNPIAISDCNVAIPLSVGPGFTVGIVDIDWRGTVFSTGGTFINFHREFFFSGSVGPFRDTNWTSSGFENFVLNDRPSFVEFSDCNGGELIARADTAAAVAGPNGLFSLRAADVGSELLLTVKVEPC
ncbi:MAG: DUF4360 domain-containing protein [Gammaproteobacteria bacterium]|nr:DUF4360 domain-containing protein [Gammaproteobacteria bacterium]